MGSQQIFIEAATVCLTSAGNIYPGYKAGSVKNREGLDFPFLVPSKTIAIIRLVDPLVPPSLIPRSRVLKFINVCFQVFVLFLKHLLGSLEKPSREKPPLVLRASASWSPPSPAYPKEAGRRFTNWYP